MKVLFDKRWTVYSSVALGIVAAVLLATRILHPGYVEDDKVAAFASIGEFHKHLNSNDLSQIYQSSSAQLKESQSLYDFEKVLQSVVDGAGKFTEVNSCDTTVLVDASQPLVRAICDDNFEKAPVTEFFTFVRTGHGLELGSYRGAVGWYALHSAEILAAKVAVTNFYKEVSAKNFTAIWTSSDIDFRQAVTEQAFASLLADVQNRVGTCGIPGLIDIDYTENERGQFVGLSYARACSRGPLNERFAWRIVNGVALLRGYHVN